MMNGFFEELAHEEPLLSCNCALIGFLCVGATVILYV